jgi:DNA polymerase-1
MQEFHIHDGNHLAHRHAHALKDFVNSRGEPVGALVGVASSLHKVVTQTKPKFLAYCFDSHCQWRRKLVPTYKAHRERNEGVNNQIDLLQTMISLYGVKVLKIKGHEADDLIGTLSRFVLPANTIVVVHTGDKDMNQLVRKDVVIQHPNTEPEDRITTKKVKEEYGISPSQFADYLALVGDKVDGFDGFVGCGAKGAKKLLEQGSLRELLAKPSLVPEAQRAEFKKQKKYIEACRKIAYIDCGIPMDLSLEDCKLKKPQWAELDKFFQEHGLNAASKRIQPWLNVPKRGLFSR